ncbi:unnamed protein product [Diatraea saccharalis]|uniref:Uncharacterized protein n=1 Tax=Diatraea saccharalis TaxID=40085 RepID=A0A9N9R5W2_9NEOP|nr:unnamed protein product [Diatraea saccharalis]
MESIKQNMAEMSAMFNSRMEQFEADLHRNAPSSQSSVAEDFAAFRSFAIAALNCLQKQVDLLSRGAERQEMRSRRRILLLHGVVEQKDEVAAEVVLRVVSEQLKIVGLSRHDISRAHRIGQHSNDKPRPILVKFCDVAIRDKIWFAKTLLRGSGVTLSEFLIPGRHKLFMEARKRFGLSKCWSRDGNIYVMSPSGNKLRVNCIAELDKIPVSASTPTAAASATSTQIAGPSVPKVQDKTRRRLPAKK